MASAYARAVAAAKKANTTETAAGFVPPASASKKAKKAKK